MNEKIKNIKNNSENKVDDSLLRQFDPLSNAANKSVDISLTELFIKTPRGIKDKENTSKTKDDNKRKLSDDLSQLVPELSSYSEKRIKSTKDPLSIIYNTLNVDGSEFHVDKEVKYQINDECLKNKINLQKKSDSMEMRDHNDKFIISEFIDDSDKCIKTINELSIKNDLIFIPKNIKNNNTIQNIESSSTLENLSNVLMMDSKENNQSNSDNSQSSNIKRIDYFKMENILGISRNMDININDSHDKLDPHDSCGSIKNEGCSESCESHISSIQSSNWISSTQKRCIISKPIEPYHSPIPLNHKNIDSSIKITKNESNNIFLPKNNSNLVSKSTSNICNENIKEDNNLSDNNIKKLKNINEYRILAQESEKYFDPIIDILDLNFDDSNEIKEQINKSSTKNELNEDFNFMKDQYDKIKSKTSELKDCILTENYESNYNFNNPENNLKKQDFSDKISYDFISSNAQVYSSNSNISIKECQEVTLSTFIEKSKEKRYDKSEKDKDMVTEERERISDSKKNDISLDKNKYIKKWESIKNDSIVYLIDDKDLKHLIDEKIENEIIYDKYKIDSCNNNLQIQTEITETKIYNKIELNKDENGKTCLSNSNISLDGSYLSQNHQINQDYMNLSLSSDHKSTECFSKKEIEFKNNILDKIDGRIYNDLQELNDETILNNNQESIDKSFDISINTSNYQNLIPDSNSKIFNLSPGNYTLCQFSKEMPENNEKIENNFSLNTENKIKFFNSLSNREDKGSDPKESIIILNESSEHDKIKNSMKSENISSEIPNFILNDSPCSTSLIAADIDIKNHKITYKCENLCQNINISSKEEIYDEIIKQNSQKILDNLIETPKNNNFSTISIKSEKNKNANYFDLKKYTEQKNIEKIIGYQLEQNTDETSEFGCLNQEISYTHAYIKKDINPIKISLCNDKNNQKIGCKRYASIEDTEKTLYEQFIDVSMNLTSKKKESQTNQSYEKNTNDDSINLSKNDIFLSAQTSLIEENTHLNTNNLSNVLDRNYSDENVFFEISKPTISDISMIQHNHEFVNEEKSIYESNKNFKNDFFTQPNNIVILKNAHNQIPDMSSSMKDSKITSSPSCKKNSSVNDINIKIVQKIREIESENANLRNLVVFYDMKMEVITKKIEEIIQDYHDRYETLKEENFKIHQNVSELDANCRKLQRKNDEMNNVLLKQRENESRVIRINSDLRRGVDLSATKMIELQKEFENFKANHEVEVNKLNTAIKIGSVNISRLEKNIADLTHQKEELTQICEELIGTHSK